MREKFVDVQASLSGDSAQQQWGNVPRWVNGHRGGSSVRMAEPLVGAALAYLSEAERSEDRDDLARSQRRCAGHGGYTWTVWVPTKWASGSGS